MKKIFAFFMCFFMFQNVVFSQTDDYSVELLDNFKYYEDIDGKMCTFSVGDENDSKQFLFDTYDDSELESCYKSEYTTPVKDQGDSGNCWAFAACGAMESAVMIKNSDSTERNFSENHLKYMISTANNNPNGFDIGIGEGGNIPMIWSYSLFGNGYVEENEFPYNEYDKNVDYGITANFPTTGYVVSETNSLPNLSNSDKIGFNETKKARVEEVKKLIKKYGCVYSEIYATGGEKLTIFYTVKDPENAYTNHAVLLVGWDDDYKKENFNSINEETPEVDGAFIVKNSWGEKSGENGFYYLSYCDMFACQEIHCITDVRKKEDNEIINTHTGGGGNGFICLTDQNKVMLNEVSYGNVFKKNYEDEKLNSVMLYMCAGQSYKISIVFSDVESDGNNLVFKENDVTGTELFFVACAQHSGYYTLKLDTSIDITNNTYAIRVDTKNLIPTTDEDGNIIDGTAIIPIEAPCLELYKGKLAVLKEVSTSPLESFFYGGPSKRNTDMNYVTNSITFQSGTESVEKTFSSNCEITAITSSELSKSKIDYMSIVSKTNTQKSTFYENETVKIAPVVEGINLKGKQLLCCVYDGNNRLVKLFEKKIENNNNVFTYEKIPKDFEKYEIRAFVVDSFDNITPLGNVKIYGQN